MKWYAAHLDYYFKLRTGKQRSFRVWENIVLIRASDADEAYDKAEERGRQEVADDDPSLTWDGRPARMVFAGVRKVTSCTDEDKRPGDGTEVTYLEMELDSESAIRKLVAMQPVSLKIADAFPDEDMMVDTNGARATQRSRA